MAAQPLHTQNASKTHKISNENHYGKFYKLGLKAGIYTNQSIS
jgi:hypothetical protein